MAASRTTLTLLLCATLQAARGATPQGVRDMCRMGQREMYHAYPGDSSRYVQCNKFGRSFVRHCNSGHAWSQALRTCVTGSVTMDTVWNDQKFQQPVETKTYPAHDKRVAMSYVHSAPTTAREPKFYHAPSKNQQRGLQYIISPLTYMYKLSAKPSYNKYDSQPEAKSDNTKSAAYTPVQFGYGTENRNPYQYYYSYKQPRSRPVPKKRFTSTAYGTANVKGTSRTYQGSIYDNSDFFGNAASNTYRAPQAKTYNIGSNKANPRSTYNKASFGNHRYNTVYGISQGKINSPSYAFGPKQDKPQFKSSRTNAYTSFGNLGNTIHLRCIACKTESTSYGDAQVLDKSASYSFDSEPRKATYDSTHRSNYGTSYNNAQSNQHSSFQTRVEDTPYGNSDNAYGKSAAFGSAQVTSQAKPYTYFYSTSYSAAPTNTISTAYSSQDFYHDGQNSYGAQYGTPNAYGQAVSHHRYKGKSARVHSPARSQVQYTQQPQPTLTTQCSENSARYFPDPNNEKRYFECISAYKLIEHVCGGTLVWVQPLRMCVDVNDKISTNVPTTNPCAGTDARYKPYPTDPSKYIECRAWYSVLVWTCKPHQIWVEEQQRCTDTSRLDPLTPIPPHHHPHHTQPTPPPSRTWVPPTVTRPISAGANPCDNTTFHFAYPGDATKFIQCDEFGHAFTRPCASSSVWNDEIKTCAKNLGFEPRTIPAVRVNPNSYDYDFSNARPLNVKDYNGYDTQQGYSDRSHYSNVRRDAKTLTHNIESSYTSSDSDDKNCNNGDLWVPSLRLCASMKDAKMDSDYCHSGDYYFPTYHVCASIRYSNVEGKSLPNKDTYSYTNYDSYVTNYDKSSQNNAGKVVSTNHCAAKYKTFSGVNPCGLNDTFYYEFPDDMDCFIQCDQLSTMYVMSCASGSIWNQEAVQCVQNNGGDYELTDLDNTANYQSNTDFNTDYGNSLNARSSNLGAHFSADYPHKTPELLCDESSNASYRQYPENAHRFVMCINNVAYPMWCPRTNLWRQDIQTCFWPLKHF